MDSYDVLPWICKVCGSKLDLDVDAEVFVGCTEKEWLEYVVQTLETTRRCIKCVPAGRV